ncbi:hypothetical protein Tco_0195994 [Tanacetum coccineum]
MGDENPIRTLGDYSKPSHEGYRNTIELLVENNVVPLRSDAIWLVKNGCSFHGLRSEDPNQHLKDFLKLMDSLDLDGENWERTLLRRTAKLRNDILMFQQHHGESLSEAWTHFKDLLQNVPHHGIDLWLKNDPRDFAKPVKAIALPQDVPSTSDRRLIELENQVQRLMEAHIAPIQPTQVNKVTTSCEICSAPYDTQYCMEDPEQAFVEYASSCTDEAGGKWYTFKPEQNNLSDTYNPSWRSHPNLRWRQPQNSQNNFLNPPNRFQPNGSIPNHSFNNRPQSFNNQSNLEGLVSNFMASQDARLSKFEADFKQQQNKMTNKVDKVLKAITDQIAGTLPSDTVKNPKLSTYPVLSARSNPTEDPQCLTIVHGLINAITICPKQPNEPQNDEPEEEEEKDNPENIHVNPPTPPDPYVSFITKKVRILNSFFETFGLVPQSSHTKLVSTKKDDGDVMFIEIVRKNDDSCKEEPEAGEQEVEYFDMLPTKSELAYHNTRKTNDTKSGSTIENEAKDKQRRQSSHTELVSTKEDDGDVMFIEIVRKNDDSCKEEPEAGEQEVEYFDMLPTKSELAYHKYLMCGPIPSIFLRNPIITEGCPSNLKITCNIGHVHVEKAYIDLNSPLNVMTRMMYNWIMGSKLNPREDANGGVSNFMGRIKGMHVFVGNFTYVLEFMIVEDISSIIDPRLSQVVLGKPIIEISNMTHDPPEVVVRFTNVTNEIAYKMPHITPYQT